MSYKTYSAVKVTILPPFYKGKELVEVDLKSGSTSQTVHKRMSQYWNQYREGSSRTIHKFKFNIDDGELEGERWLSAGISQCLGSGDVFYKADKVGLYGDKAGCFRWKSSCHAHEEQKLINTNRKIAREFTNSKVKVVLHHGLPTDKRANPAPYCEEINEEYYKHLKGEIRKKLKQEIKERSENNPEFIEAKEALSDAQKKLKELKSTFLGERPELLAIEI